MVLLAVVVLVVVPCTYLVCIRLAVMTLGKRAPGWTAAGGRRRGSCVSMSIFSPVKDGVSGVGLGVWETHEMGSLETSPYLAGMP